MTTLLIIAVIAFVISCGSDNRDLQFESDDESGITWDEYGNPNVE